MHYEFEWGGPPEDVRITVFGLASVDGFARLFDELTDSPAFKPRMRILLDLTRVDMTELPVVDAAEIGLGLGQLQGRCEGCAVAVVCGDPLTRRLIEMADLGHPSGVDVFRALSRSEAASWLELRPVAVGQASK